MSLGSTPSTCFQRWFASTMTPAGVSTVSVSDALSSNSVRQRCSARRVSSRSFDSCFALVSEVRLVGIATRSARPRVARVDACADAGHLRAEVGRALDQVRCTERDREVARRVVVVVCADEDDRNRREQRVVAETAAQPEAVDVVHHHVADDDVGRMPIARRPARPSRSRHPEHRSRRPRDTACRACAGDRCHRRGARWSWRISDVREELRRERPDVDRLANEAGAPGGERANSVPGPLMDVTATIGMSSTARRRFFRDDLVRLRRWRELGHDQLRHALREDLARGFEGRCRHHHPTRRLEDVTRELDARRIAVDKENRWRHAVALYNFGAARRLRW